MKRKSKKQIKKEVKKPVKKEVPTLLKEELKEFRANRKTFKKSKPLHEQLNNYEKQLIRQALINCDWNQTQAAKLLDISERNIRFKMEKLSIDKPAKDSQ